MLKLYHSYDALEAGCDEAGRGCLAGPVIAAAVILPHDFVCTDLNDSKLLTESKRFELKDYIEQNALCFAIGICDVDEIEMYNILWASVAAMHKAIDQLPTQPHHIIVDGNRFKKYQNIEHTCVVKGDSKYLSIAAASVLAKTYRDLYMQELHELFPVYGWNKNKGYPTLEHRAGIVQYGITHHHRPSFKLLPEEKQRRD